MRHGAGTDQHQQEAAIVEQRPVPLVLDIAGRDRVGTQEPDDGLARVERFVDLVGPVGSRRYVEFVHPDRSAAPSEIAADATRDLGIGAMIGDKDRARARHQSELSYEGAIYGYATPRSLWVSA